MMKSMIINAVTTCTSELSGMTETDRGIDLRSTTAADKTTGMSLDYIKKLPKAELHCHLDGSVPVSCMQKIIQDAGDDYNYEALKKLMTVPEGCTSLAEYLETFTIPLKYMQTKKALKACAYEMAKEAAAENVRYLEVRFAPAFHLEQGLTIREVLESAEAGLLQAKLETGIETGILCCGMRNLTTEANIAMYRQAREMLGSGVVGVDLAGGEAGQTVVQWREIFAEAKRLGLPFTIHAGECGRADNVREAVELGALRVGHGIAMTGHTDIIKLCRERHTGIEMCPTSNLQTRATENLAGYPFVEFVNAGLAVTINTDNRTVSGTNMTQEIALLQKYCGLEEEIYRRIYQNTVEVSFASDDVKHKLLTSSPDFK